MTYLFIDVETEGKAKNFKSERLADPSNWPRIVSFAWLLCTDNGLIDAGHEIVRRDWACSPKAIVIHGITDEMAKEAEYDIVQILEIFRDVYNQADVVVAHNLKFDRACLCSEMTRNEFKGSFKEVQKICTMHASVEFCKIPGMFGTFKWPKLEELYRILFGKDFEGAHTASGDVAALELCFFELKRLGVINVGGII